MGETSHEEDLRRVIADLKRERAALFRTLRPIEAGDFDRARPGGWSIGRVAQHLVESDVLYAKLLAHQTQRDAGDLPGIEPADGASTMAALMVTQRAMLHMVEGIDAETLYRMTKVGHEEYSPLSLLENIAMHDGEHQAQIESLLRAPADPDASPARRRLPPGVTIRRGTEADIGAINDIYNHYIRETPITFDVEEWTLEQRREWFKKFAETGRHQLFVAEDGGRIVGFAGTGMFRPKQAYETSPEVTIYCAHDATARGIGTALYTRLFDALRGEDIHSIVAGITLPNDASCRLHESFGFRRAGVFHGVGRKFDRYWDVAWYERIADD